MPRLLVLEDDLDSLTLLSMLLESCGFEVVGAASSGSARTHLRARSFDLVLADLVVDSTDLERSWVDVDKLVALTRPARVGLLTGWPVKPEQLAKHGIAFALAKPFHTEALLEAIAAALAVPALHVAQEHVLRAYFECLERGDWDGLVACCTEDVVYQLPVDDPKFGRVTVGRDALREHAETTFREFREPRFAIDTIRALPRGAVVHYRGSWLAPDGTRPVAPGSVMFVLDGDRIAEIGVRVDTAALTVLRMGAAS